MAEITAISDNKWRLSEKGIAVAYGFRPELGIYLAEFSIGGANYCKAEKSIVPVVNTDPAIENGRPPFSWDLVSADFGEKTYHKRPVKQLDVVIETVCYRLYFHAVIFPGVSVVKQWWECENTSLSRTNGFTLKPFAAELLQDDYKKSYWFSSFGGGHTRPTQGDMISRMIGANQKYTIGGSMTAEYMPLFTVTCEEEPYDGFMIALDYLGEWSLDFWCEIRTMRDHPFIFEFTADGGRQIETYPREILPLPGVTICAFNGGHDAMMKELYDWQYKYMFDVTSDKYYAATKITGPWDCENRVLAEQFAYRACNFDLNGITDAASVGARGFWSDAGWYSGDRHDCARGYLFLNSMEGPDFRESVKFAEKCGIGYTLWFAGKPLDGVLAAKAAYWGDFEWRTDAFNVRNQREYVKAKDKIAKYTGESAERSFHSCDGGGNYCHNFEIQRLTSFNYVSDLNASPYINYYSSYFELPDKQNECMDGFGADALKYNGASAFGGLYEGTRDPSEEYKFSRLTLIPSLGTNLLTRKYGTEKGADYARERAALYEYFLRNGVAGRFSYVFHPRVYGDKEYYYRLRRSADGRKAVLIFSRPPRGKVTVFPDGLLEGVTYAVAFYKGGKAFKATGKELLENGITVTPEDDPGLIFFNLPDFPFGKNAKGTPSPSAVFKRYETNVKTPGVGVYVSAPDDGRFYLNFIRDGKEIAKIARGNYYFDASPEADINAVYSVSAVGFNGCETAAVAAKPLKSAVDAFYSAGCYTADADVFRGFSNEYGKDGRRFLPMKRVPATETPAGDLGKTPNRPGGPEGNFEGSGNTRIGRAWFQAGDLISARTFTASSSMTARVTGRVSRDYFKDAASAPITARILKNAEELWRGRIAAGKNEIRYHDLTVDLKKGDKLRFVIDKIKTAKKTVYQYEPEAVTVAWAPKITPVAPEKAGGTLCRVSLSGKDEYFGGSLYKGKKIAAENGSVAFEMKTDAAINDVVLVFDSDDKYIDEGAVTVRLNGRTYTENADIVRDKMSKSGPVMKRYAAVLSENGVVSVDVSLSGGARLLYAAAAGEKTFGGFYTLAKKSYIDFSGDLWTLPAVKGGRVIKADAAADQNLPTVFDKPLYEAFRVGKDVTVDLPVKDGIYTLRLLTANTVKPEGFAPEFDVFINGKKVLSDYNVEKAAEGANIALCLRFEGVMPENGKITLHLKAYGKRSAAAIALLLD